MPTRPVSVPNTCANCQHLGWGPEEGWDKCGKTGNLIAWSQKATQVCEDHARAAGDPRVKTVSTPEERLERVRALLTEWEAMSYGSLVREGVCRELRKALEG